MTQEQDEHDKRVRLRCAPAVVREIERVMKLASKKDQEALQSALDKGGLTSQELQTLIRAREADKGGAQQSLIDLLRADKGKGGVVLPEPPKPKTNPDLEKRRAWLIARQQRREYEASVANIRHKRPYEKAQESMSEVRRAMKEVSVGIMMILVCVAVFLALKMTADARGLPPQVGLQWGLFGGSAMLFVEMILFAIRTTRAETESRKERAFLDRQVTNISQLPVIPGGKEAMKKFA